MTGQPGKFARESARFARSEAAGRSGTRLGFSDSSESNNSQALSFVYPHGATLNVARPAIPILSTGSVSFPLNRPVCALYQNLSEYELT